MLLLTLWEAQRRIRAIARRLYGRGHRGEDYVSWLAEDLQVSHHGARKWWYGQRRPPNTVWMVLKDLLAKR